MSKSRPAVESSEKLRVAGGISEQGVVVGNTYDKYGSSNPLVQRIMGGFEQALEGLVALAKPRSIHEVGCGEGYWTLRWTAQGLQVRGSDFSEQVIEIARENARERGLTDEVFQPLSIYDLDPDRDSADLVVCCEVLEHLEHPEAALRALQGVVRRHLILSVPREPLWSLMNLARGKYWSELGNTPGHVQRWSQRTFKSLVERYFHILETRAPVPWTMLLCEPRDRPG